jgi:hypothetical protein
MAEGRGRVVCGTFDHEGKMPDSDTHAEFEPQTTQSMVDALVVTFRVLRLSARRPDLAALATRKIIELAGAGEREVERLKRAARDNNSSCQPSDVTRPAGTGSLRLPGSLGS